MFGANSELDSVMEFGYKLTYSTLNSHVQWLSMSEI